MNKIEVPWGSIPDNWIISSVATEAKRVTDYVANGSFASLAENVEYKAEEDYAVLIRLVDYNNSFKGPFVFIDEKAYNFLSKSKLFGGEIIISNVGANVGTVFLCPYLKYNMSLAPNSITVHFKGNDIFYYYWLRSKYGQHGIKSLITGSAQPKFNKTAFRQMLIPVPPLDVQNQIAGILSSLDAKIETNNKLNEKLEEMAQAIFKSWFVDFEPFKDKPFHETELGMIPEGWEVGSLSDIATITMGQSPCGTSYNENGEGIIFYQGRTEFGFRFPSIRLYTTAPSRFAEVGSTLMSVRAPVGDINMALLRCCIGRGVASIKSNCDCDSYIYYLMKSLKKRFDIYNGEGTVFGSVGRDTLRGMLITIPPSSVISDFEMNISKIDSRIKTNELESQRLASLRDTLLPRLMSGELIV